MLSDQISYSTHQQPLNRRHPARLYAFADAAQSCSPTRKLQLHHPNHRGHESSLAARQIACAGSSSGLTDQAQDATAEVPANQQGIRHAILHDFCMSIPFGSIVLAAGVVSLLFGSGKQGLSFASAGTGILAASFFSLVQWRAQRPSTMFTLLSAGITATLAWGFWGLVEAGIAPMPNTVMSFLSLAMLTFLIYNIFAGGNPPKKTTAEDDEELAAAAASAT